MNTADNRRQLLHMLEAMELEPAETEKGNIEVGYQGRDYTLYLYDNDYQFYEIATHILSFYDESLRPVLARCCAQTTKGVKLAKVMMVKANIIASSEQFVPDAGHLEPHLARTFGALQYAADTFIKTFEETEWTHE